jgi:hypothetical protein
MESSATSHVPGSFHDKNSYNSGISMVATYQPASGSSGKPYIAIITRFRVLAIRGNVG